MNGTPISSPSALQDIFTKQVGRCQYDVQSYDVHVTNKDYRIGRPEGLSEKGGGEGRRLSLLVTVSGVAKFGTEESGLGEARAFSDVVFLVPNWSSFGGKGGNIKARKWVIQNQTFRVVVWNLLALSQSRPVSKRLKIPERAHQFYYPVCLRILE